MPKRKSCDPFSLLEIVELAIDGLLSRAALASREEMENDRYYYEAHISELGALSRALRDLERAARSEGR